MIEENNFFLFVCLVCSIPRFLFHNARTFMRLIIRLKSSLPKPLGKVIKIIVVLSDSRVGELGAVATSRSNEILQLYFFRKFFVFVLFWLNQTSSRVHRRLLQLSLFSSVRALETRKCKEKGKQDSDLLFMSN